MLARRHFALLVGALAILTSGASTAGAADVAHGEHVFGACAACHSKDHTNRSGPGLEGIVGRTAGSAPGFHYSRAMKSSGVVWDDQRLDAYLTAPQKAVPGNTMPFAGIANAQDRADLISYLDTLK